MTLDKIICSNASPIWHLGRIRELKGSKIPETEIVVTTALDIDILKRIYSEILIPAKVKEELLINKRCPGIAKTFVETNTKSLKVRDRSLVHYLLQQYMNGIRTTRNIGECETFVLASEMGLKALLANDGAETMFDREKAKGRQVNYLSLIPFGEQCWHANIVAEADFKNFLEILNALGYSPSRHTEYFDKYGIDLSS